ncbi:MAG: glycosyl transferase family 1 [Rhodospirillales bacterium]|nr:glycosyl transferase family 1 [Rhodospirillales bacterium]
MLSPGRRPARLLMTTDAVGGVWTYALDLARGLAAAGTEVTLAVLGPPPDETQARAAAAIAGLRLVPTGLPLDWDMATDAAALADTGATLATAARVLDVDLVHLNSSILAAEAAFSVPVVGGCHSCLATWWQAVKGAETMPPEFAWRRDLLEAAYRRCAALIAPSRAFAAVTAGTYGVAAPIAIYNARVPAMTASAPAVDIFTAGRLWDEGKNLVALDRAAALIDAPIHAAGPVRSPYGQGIRLDHLRLLGTLDTAGIAGCLASRPVFVSTALYEPFGLAVLEAAQAGCALVLSDIPTFRELWDGVARFVPARDACSIAEALRALAGDPVERRRAGAAAAQRANDYAIERMVRETLHVYGRVLAHAAEQAVA